MWLEIQHFQKFKYGSWSFQFGYSPLSNCRWLIVGRCRQFFSFFFLFGRVGVVLRSNLYINRLKSSRFFPKIRNWLPLTIRERNGMQRQAEFFCFILDIVGWFSQFSWLFFQRICVCISIIQVVNMGSRNSRWLFNKSV